MNVLSEHGFRADGRRPEQIRNISCKLSVCPEADGSAYIEQGNTRVSYSIFIHTKYLCWHPSESPPKPSS